MRDGQASATAVLPGVLRAAHQILDADPRILSDPVSPRLLAGWSESEILERREDLDNPVMRHLRSAFVVRSRLAEDELERAVALGTSQYVLLGAGLDTFAFRQPPWARPLRIIEVDHPASQEFKRGCLSRSAFDEPGNLEFCPIDFESASLREGLAASSFDPGAPTFFSWLGVSQYLTRSAIEETLRFVSGMPGPSTIGFTFALPESSLSGIDLQVARFSAAGAERGGEPWLTRFEPAPLRSWILELGFARFRHFTPEWCEEAFYSGRQDGLRLPLVEQFATAQSDREPRVP